MIRKSILIFIALSFYSMCFAWSIQDAHKAVIERKNAAAAPPCTTMGASGTYDHWWNGEYAADTDKACQDSGASVVDASEATAGVIHAGGAINGAIGALLNADAEHVRWAAKSQTIDTAGTVQITVTTPAAYNHNLRIFEIFHVSAGKYITEYYNVGNDKIYLYISSGASGAYSVTAPAESTTITIQFSWNDATDALAIKLGAGAWGIQTNDNWSEFGGAVNYLSIGEDNISNTGGTDIWKLDDVQFRVGYEAS